MMRGNTSDSSSLEQSADGQSQSEGGINEEDDDTPKQSPKLYLLARCAERLVEKLNPDILNASAVNVEEKFSQLTLDVIGLSLFNYNFNSLTTNSPVIDAVYTALKEAELRSTDLLPYWKVSSTQLRDDLLSVLVAGHETTGSVLTWTAYLLSKDPSSLRKAQEEVDRVLQGRLPIKSLFYKLHRFEGHKS